MAMTQANFSTEFSANNSTTSPETLGVVKSIDGVVTVKRAGADIALKAGDPILPGDVLTADKVGKAQLEFPAMLAGQHASVVTLLPAGQAVVSTAQTGLVELVNLADQDSLILEDSTEAGDAAVSISNQSHASGFAGLLGATGLAALGPLGGAAALVGGAAVALASSDSGGDNTDVSTASVDNTGMNGSGSGSGSASSTTTPAEATVSAGTVTIGQLQGNPNTTGAVAVDNLQLHLAHDTKPALTVSNLGVLDINQPINTSHLPINVAMNNGVPELQIDLGPVLTGNVALDVPTLAKDLTSVLTHLGSDPAGTLTNLASLNLPINTPLDQLDGVLNTVVGKVSDILSGDALHTVGAGSGSTGMHLPVISDLPVVGQLVDSVLGIVNADHLSGGGGIPVVGGLLSGTPLDALSHLGSLGGLESAGTGSSGLTGGTNLLNILGGVGTDHTGGNGLPVVGGIVGNVPVLGDAISGVPVVGAVLVGNGSPTSGLAALSSVVATGTNSLEGLISHTPLSGISSVASTDSLHAPLNHLTHLLG